MSKEIIWLGAELIIIFLNNADFANFIELK